MQDVRALIQSVADTALSSRVRKFNFTIYDGSVKTNAYGVEVQPEPKVGTIVAHQDGYYVQKIGLSELAAHKESLIPMALNIGDKVEIQHAGFKATDDGKQDEVEPGMMFRTYSFSLSAKRLAPPKKHSLLQDMTEQLSELKLPDGRRGYHMLSDLKFANFRGDADEELSTNPYLEFEVTGAKFTGTVRMELILGMDTYEMHFINANGTIKLENVVAMEVLELIEKHCDSGPARMATVKLISKAKTPKVKAAEPA